MSVGEPTPSTTARRGIPALAVPLLVFAALAGLFALGLRGGDPSKLPSALLGKPAPAYAFQRVEELVREGAAVPGFSEADLGHGKVAVVNFWASWCAPCTTEQADLVELAKRSGVAVYGVNYKDQPAAARRFLSRYGNPFTAVGADGNGRGAIEWGVYGMPETFVVGPDGRIVLKHVGPISADDIERELLPAIAKAAAGSSGGGKP
jgi:cytochrome c biogenesis protein CcmG, thiol:disulfide interchange protein DsbE